MTLGQRHRYMQHLRRRSFEEYALDAIDLRAYMEARQQRRIETPAQTKHAA